MDGLGATDGNNGAVYLSMCGVVFVGARATSQNWWPFVLWPDSWQFVVLAVGWRNASGIVLNTGRHPFLLTSQGLASLPVGGVSCGMHTLLVTLPCIRLGNWSRPKSGKKLGVTRGSDFWSCLHG